MGTLEKIRGQYYTTLNGMCCAEWTLADVVDLAVLEAVRLSMYDGLEGKGIVDALRGEWHEVKLSEKNMKEVKKAYIELMQKCIGDLQKHMCLCGC